MKKHIMFVFGVLLLSMLMVNGVEAAEGEFMDDTLEDYKNTAEVTAEQVNRAESYMENGMFLDKYDYETNQFDCKWYEVMCQTNGFLFTTVSGFVFGAIDSFGKFQIDSSIITGNPTYEGYMLNLKSLAWTMTAIFLLWQTVKIVILYSSNGDEGMNTLYEKLIAVVTGSILLGIYGELFEWILEMTHLLTEMLLTSPVTHYKMMQVLAVNSVGYGIILMLVVSAILFVFFLSI
ncbi:MAG: hypothetical protein IMZ40_01660, partial [Bacilli bacterium]|nr:hypothetical protein [Bacilli bacterium]